MGVDSPALRSLAGLDRAPTSDAGAVVEAAAIEIGLVMPDLGSAARHLARRLSRMILQEKLDPFEGARQLAEISRTVVGFHDLDPFVYADSEAEDRPEDREFFREAIVAEARRWAS
jgi:hypothetical protein